MRRRRTSVVLAAAVAASVVLHLGVVAFALSRPRPAPTPRQRPLEVTVVEIIRPPRPVVPEVPEVPEPIPPPAPPRPPRRIQPPTTAQQPPLPPPPEHADDAPREDAPRMTQAPPAHPPLSLLPRAQLGLAPEGAASDFGVSDEQARRGLRAPEIPKDLVKHTAREAVGKAKVKRGLVHPYYTELGKAMLKRWDADRAVSAKGLRGWAENTRANSQLSMRVWQENAERFAATGSPLQDAADDAPRMPERVSAGADEIRSRRQALKRQNRQEWRSTRRAELRVVQDATGRIVAAELVKPSNDPHVDKEAVADVRAAAEAMPPPPPEVLAGRTELVSHWLFELIVSINPPVPTFSFEFDEALGYIDPRLPLDRRIYKRVRLLAVD